MILALLWLVGINLRTVVLSVPPTLPALHRALALSYSAAGLLTSLPVLIMAVGAIPGAYLVSRVGARQAVTYGLALLAVGTALRGAFPNAAALFLFTVVLSLGIAVSQPAVPSLVQAWLPERLEAGRAEARRVRAWFDEQLDGADAVLMPATPFAAPRGDDDEVETRDGQRIDVHVGGPSTFTRAVNLAGLPSLAMPAGRTGDGLPLGVQLVGRPGSEPLLLATAAELEQLEDRFTSPSPPEP